MKNGICAAVSTIYFARGQRLAAGLRMRMPLEFASAFNDASKIQNGKKGSERAPLAIISNGGARTRRPSALAVSAVACCDHTARTCSLYIATLSDTVDGRRGD